MPAGNLGLRRHARFMPGEFKYQETKAPPLKDAYDEFLARIICFVFSVSPEPFVGQVNRATAQTSHARATDEGLAPLMRYIRALLNRIIATEFASPDLEFAWEETRAQDPAQAAQIDVAYVGAGILTVDEVRANLGLEPLEKLPHATAQKYNRNHLGPGPGGGQFTEASRNGTSNGLPPGAGTPQRSELAVPPWVGTKEIQVAGGKEIAAELAAESQREMQEEEAEESAGIKSVIKPEEMDLSDTQPSVANAMESIGNAISAMPYVNSNGTLLNAQDAIVTRDKMNDYILNPLHKVGGNKAIVFNSALGYNQSNADDLAGKLKEGLPRYKAEVRDVDEHGARFSVDMPITGPNGNTATVRSGWIFDSGSSTRRLVSARVQK